MRRRGGTGTVSFSERHPQPPQSGLPTDTWKTRTPRKWEANSGSPAYGRKLPYLTTGALLKWWEHCQNQLLVMSECAVGSLDGLSSVGLLGVGVELRILTS